MSAQRRIRFIDSTDLEGLGLRIKLMPHIKSLPLSSPKSFHYTFTRGTETWKEELFDPIELWFQSQHAGRWTDPDGSTLTLAMITRHRPRGFEREHVSREAYEQALDMKENRPPTTWNAELISHWVRDFVGTARAKAIVIRPSPSLSIYKAFRFSLPDEPATRIGYAIQLRPIHRTSPSYKSPWFYVQFDLGDGISAATGPSTIERSFLGSIRCITRPTPSAASRSRSSMQNNQQSGGETAAFKQSRDTVIQSIANMQNWWYVETENYIVLSDLSSRHRPMVKALQADVEALREVYSKIIPPIAPISAVGVIRMPSEADLYLSYTGGGKDWSGGMWMPTIRELLIRPPENGTTRDQRKRFLKVAYHEAFHQYLFYALGKRSAPPWFNEGHAEFFENATIQKGRVRVGESETQLPRLLDLIKQRRLSIAELLAMDYPQFYDADAEKRSDNYTLAWGLIYYLRKGAIQERPARYHGICDAFLEALTETDASEIPTQRAFQAVNMRRFERQFIDFWTSRKRRSTAERMAIAVTRR